MRALIPVANTGGELRLSEFFGKAPAFALVEIEGSSYKLIELVENPYAEVEHSRRAQGIYQLIAEKRPELILTTHIGPGLFYRLKDKGIKIYYAPAGLQLSELVELFRGGSLSEAREPREPAGHHH